MDTKEKIGVIGGGPAGIIAAGYAGSRGKNVTLLERNNKLGKKMYITGKGRCNLTNASPIETFFDNIPTNRNFLYSSLYTYTNEDIISLLEGYGLKVKVERGNRVFPLSDKSSDVITILERFLLDNGVNIQFNSYVTNIKYEKNRFIVYLQNGRKLKFHKLILATGGVSYPATGSTGDGHKFATSFGHNITELKPSLVGIEVDNRWIDELQGLALKNVELITYVNNREICREFGELLFAHYGISGPIALRTSTYINKIKSNNIEFRIDLKPALSKEKLDRRIVRDFKSYSNRQLNNGLLDLLPQRLIPIIINESKINKDKRIHQITKEERERLVNNIKKLTLNFKGLRDIKNAIVTSGGVSVKEVEPSTMESKLIPGLFFAGEIIDVDGLTGGYNLQIAYSTGYLAGINV